MPLRSRLSEIRSRLKDSLEGAKTGALVKVAPQTPAVAGEEPPVVARLVVEIRSDGSQTIARGALEDLASGERVDLEARGTTPAQLATSLAKTIFAAPFLARAAVHAMLQRGKDRKRKPEDDVGE